MLGILLVSHGSLSKGVKEAVDTIMYGVEKIDYLTLFPSDDIEQLTKKINEKVEELNDGDGVLILCDLLNGSPCVRASRFAVRDDIEIISGLNLPMLLSAIECRINNVNNLKVIAEQCKENGAKGIVNIKDNLKNVLNNKNYST